jgi:hypothetical protein
LPTFDTTDNHDAELERAELAARLAYENLARLGESCACADQERAEILRDRDHAILGVARWGYSHRALAEAARVTPQRVTQILLAKAHRANPGVTPAGLVAQGARPAARSAPSRSRRDLRA